MGAYNPCLGDTNNNTRQRGVKMDRESADRHRGLSSSFILGEPKKASQRRRLVRIGEDVHDQRSQDEGKAKPN